MPSCPERRSPPNSAKREDALCAAEMQAQAAVWQTVPTTAAGRMALVDFARSMVARRTNSEGDVDDSGYLLGRVLDAFSAMVAADRGNTAQPIAEPSPAPVALDYGERAKLSAEQIELSGLDVLSLAHLFEAFQAARFFVEGVVAHPCCDRGQLGDLLDSRANGPPSRWRGSRRKSRAGPRAPTNSATRS